MAAIWSPWLKEKNIVSNNLFHITDWLPTLYTAAGKFIFCEFEVLWVYFNNDITLGLALSFIYVYILNN